MLVSALDPRAAVAVVDSAELLGGPAAGRPVTGPVVVWDPAGGPVAVSVAETLAAEGLAVTLVTPDFLVGSRLSHTGDLVEANARLWGAGVELVRRTQVVAVTAEGVEVEDRWSGVRRLLPAAALVDCGFRRPDETLWEHGRSRGAHVSPPGTRAGDGVAPRSIYEAILGGRRAALAIEGIAARLPIRPDDPARTRAGVGR
jgi:2,4-dienoyl-CoA reductase (NADPH2)